MTKDISKAKKIFFDYSSSKFQMSRDGMLHEYEGHGISEEQEQQWLSELLNIEFNKLDINDYSSIFPFWYVVEINCDLDQLQKFLEFIEANINNTNNQYSVLRFGQTVFDLVQRLSKNSKNLSKELKIRCLNIAELLNNKCKDLSIPDNFIIPDFSIVGEGLTQQQYVLRKISELDYHIEIARILN